MAGEATDTLAGGNNHCGRNRGWEGRQEVAHPRRQHLRPIDRLASRPQALRSSLRRTRLRQKVGLDVKSNVLPNKRTTRPPAPTQQVR